MRIGVKKKLLELLSDNQYHYAGKLEDAIRQEFGPKGSTANRRLQEMAHSGTIETKKDTHGHTIIPKQYKLVFSAPLGQDIHIAEQDSQGVLFERAERINNPYAFH